MKILPPEQHMQIVQIYYHNNGSVHATVIPATLVRFHTMFTLVDNAQPQRRHTVRTEDAFAAEAKFLAITLNYVRFISS